MHGRGDGGGQAHRERQEQVSLGGAGRGAAAWRGSVACSLTQHAKPAQVLAGGSTWPATPMGSLSV